MPVSESSHSIQLNGSLLNYQLDRSRRRSLTIQVLPDLRIVVKAPLRSDPAWIEAMIEKRATWILGQLRFQQDYSFVSPPRQYTSGAIQRFLGSPLRLQIEHRPRGIVIANTSSELIVSLAGDPSPARIQQALERWYRSQATQIFNQRLDYWFSRVSSWKVKRPTISVRLMRSRWGSCHPDGGFSINLTLVQMPLEIIDYILVHELCHLRERNHGPRFYRLLESLMPDWRVRRQALKKGLV